MEYTNDVERRLTELEIKASLAEDLLDTLDALVARQQETIETMVREIARLRQQQTPPSDGLPPNTGDERPPHY
jgi:SlyX protein